MILLGILLEVYIDDIVTKQADLSSHLANLHLAFERMHWYCLKMNLLMRAFGVSSRKFVGFIIHENGIDIDLKNIESTRKIKAPTCKRDCRNSKARCIS